MCSIFWLLSCVFWAVLKMDIERTCFIFVHSVSRRGGSCTCLSNKASFERKKRVLGSLLAVAAEVPQDRAECPGARPLGLFLLLWGFL